MANNSEFYRGKNKKKLAPALIGTVIVLAVIAFVVLLFYGLQKYIVVTNDGLHLEIPFLEEDGKQTTQNDDGIVVQSFEPVNAELEIGQPDYTNVKATAGEGLESVKLVHVPASSVNESGIESYLGKNENANGVLLDVKTVTGMLVWDSDVDVAKGYGTTGTVNLKSIVSDLKEREMYVAVRLCCFVDNTLASRYTQLALRTTDGNAYSDDNGAWLDPTHAVVKSYIAGLCSELSKMGVDEIVLFGMRLPDVAGLEFAFSSTSAVTPTPVTAVSGFGISVTRAMRSASAKLSVQLTSSTALQSGTDSVTGQDAALLFKIFERVYYQTDSDSASSAVSTAQQFVQLGDVKQRLVPMCYDGAPATSCWVLLSY